MTNLKKQRGFSLIELLIVVGILVLLAIISVVALNDQQAKARDAKRISDVRQIRTALEFYSSDENEYPIRPNPVVLGQDGQEKLCSKAEGGFVAASVECKTESTYMNKIPTDPMSDRKYVFTSDGKGYDIVFTTEKISSLGQAGTYHAHSQIIDQAPGNR